MLPAAMRSSRDNEEFPSFKVCICGEESVGKTALLNRYVTGSFHPGYRPTIAASFISSQEIVDYHVVILNIWDTAGQEKYQSMMPLYLRNADVVILVLDVTKLSSFRYVCKWYEVEYPNLHPHPTVYICANKSDLDPAFDTSQIGEWAQSNQLSLFHTSALSGVNVPALFKKIAQDMNSERLIKNKKKTSLSNPKENESRSCC